MTEQTNMSVCPCCGGAPKIRRDTELGMSMIVCSRCGLSTSPRGSLERSVNAWNNRFDPYAVDRNVLRSAIREYGNTMQLTVAVEELSELQKEICKSIRTGACSLGMAEEIADVEIMLEQIRMIFPDESEAIGLIKHQKVERLKKRIKERYN